MFRVLEDIKVLDLSRIYAAPGGSMILADLGADVIRIELPGGADSMREWGPYVNHQSTYYLTANRNKKSMTLNLKTEQGRELFLNLVQKADVVLENFKTGTLERMELSYNHLKKINDQIIMCSVTGYGQTGPYKYEPGFDPIIQALSGLMEVTGDANGSPTRVGIPITDIITSKYVAISILSAIRMRDFTQKGQHIDLSLLDVQMSNMTNITSSFLNTGIEAKRMGNSHNNVVPYQVFDCQDAPIMISVGNNSLFARMCNLFEHPEWIRNPKYATNNDRVENKEELTQNIGNILRDKKADEWIALFSASKIPAGKVNNIKEALSHPQVKARKVVETMGHPIKGKIKLTKSPMRFSELNISNYREPPLLGEHTKEILSEELGLTSKEIEELQKLHII